MLSSRKLSPRVTPLRRQIWWHRIVFNHFIIYARNKIVNGNSQTLSDMFSFEEGDPNRSVSPCALSMLRQIHLKMALSHWKRLKCFSSRPPNKFENATITWGRNTSVHLEGKCQSHDYLDFIIFASFSKLLPKRLKRKAAFSNFSRLKSVFEKLRFAVEHFRVSVDNRCTFHSTKSSENFET